MDNKKFLDYNGLLYFYSLLNSKFLKTETDPVFVALKSNIVSTVELNPSSSTTYSDGYKHITLTETDPTVPSWAKLSTKPSYNFDEITDGTTNKAYTDTEKTKLASIIAGVNRFEVGRSSGDNSYIGFNDGGDTGIIIRSDSEGLRLETAANGNVTVTPGGTGKLLYNNNEVLTTSNLNSPTLTGTPTAPTATAGTNTTLIATTAFVSTAVTNAMAGVTSISYSVLGANEDLPVTGTTGVIYLKPKTGSTGDGYDEYIYVNNTYELIGHKVLDLSTYWDETHLAAMTNLLIALIVYPLNVEANVTDEDTIMYYFEAYIAQYNAQHPSTVYVLDKNTFRQDNANTWSCLANYESAHKSVKYLSSSGLISEVNLY